MADIADIAAEREQLDTARAIEAARKRLTLAPVPCGHCYNCDEPVGEGAAFCDADCRDDWQVRKRLQGMA
ncbi:DUF2116 family Zn-ribbon domain-containing protein [Pseudothauera nasutitermitis]|uniref:DUF2116 family Zn-ribbon domain-containing protein n=1 Tax=Pseudothauera nasutitermitis TaxID=2565930 RepID=A0A4S4AP69_9RHOO|nr:DUF2116 family Zn-ribbon domain-containing protein [Pseudothauera nasutitermitis]THF61416.1 DUF2116 family Zn-ribbon domain-containing protein [Pseudothauera nasutitermitis]